MIELGTLTVENWATWGRGSLDLGTPGVHFVRGRNDDANGNPNGAGKSSLCNALYAMLFGDHQLAVRKRSLKSAVNSATHIGMEFIQNRKTVVADMLGTELKVTVDGKSVDSRTRDGERSALLDLLGFTPELWSATVHVNGIAGNPLIRGTSAMRCQFLEKAFSLDRWAGRHTKIGEVISQMRRADQDLNDVKRQLAEMGPKVDGDAARAKLEAATDRLKKIRIRSRELSDTVARLESLPRHPGKSMKQLRDGRERLEKALRDVSATTREHDDYQRAVEDRNTAQSERAALIRELKGLGPADPLPLDELRRAASDAEHAAEQAASAAEHRETVAQWAEVAKSVARKHGMSWANYTELAALSRSWVRNLKPGSKSCPVCGSRIKGEVDPIQMNELAALTRDLPDGEIRIGKEGDYERKSVVAGKLNDRLEKLERRVRLIADIKRIHVPELPMKPRGEPRDAGSIADSLARVCEAEGRARQWEESGLDTMSASADLDKARARLKKLDSLERDLDASLPDLQAVADTAYRDQTTRKSLEDRKARLEGELTLRPAYKALHAAYSPNGMRLWLLSELLEALIAGLNSGSHSTRDRCEYGYKLSRNRELTLTASNAKGTFDVRLLSGAESGLFCLNLLTVMLPMLPSSRRVGTLILDEIDANASDESKEIMASEYLPRLAKMVDSMWVVTPSSPRAYKSAGSDEYLVVKKHTVSRMITPENRLRRVA